MIIVIIKIAGFMDRCKGVAVTCEPLTALEDVENMPVCGHRTNEARIINQKGQKNTQFEIKKDSTTDSRVSFEMTQAQLVYMVMHPATRRSDRVRAVADWLVEVLADQ